MDSGVTTQGSVLLKNIDLIYMNSKEIKEFETKLDKLIIVLFLVIFFFLCI